MKLIVRLFFACFLIFSTCGCAAIILGAAGILGGVAISDDTVESFVDKDFNSLWNASLDVLEKIGSVTEKNKDEGVIKAAVEKSTVTIKLEEISEKTTKLKVSARKMKNVIPDIDTATKINNKIVKKATKGWF